MVNWVKGTAEGEPRRLIVDGTSFEPKFIPPTLQLDVNLTGASALAANARGSSQGLVLGTKEFQFESNVAAELRRDKRARRFVKPVAVASHMLRGKLSTEPEYVVDMSQCENEAEAKLGGAAYDYLRKHVYAFVKERATSATTDHYKNWLRTWWRPFWPRLDFLADIKGLPRIIVCSRHAARPVFVFLSTEFFATESMQLFGFADDYSFGILQSSFHWRWAVGIGSKIKEDTRYTGDVWESFPWPQDPPESTVVAVATAARALRAVRDKLMRENGWSLRDLYQSADVPGAHPLNNAQAALDRAVGEAYGIPPDQDIPEFLLELNHALKEDEDAGRAITGPGLPKQFDRTDPRWMSTDCIEPAPTEN
jgi:hypothetical protein